MLEAYKVVALSPDYTDIDYYFRQVVRVFAERLWPP